MLHNASVAKLPREDPLRTEHGERANQDYGSVTVGLVAHLGIGLSFSSRVHQTKRCIWTLKQNMHRKAIPPQRDHAWPTPKLQDASFDVLESPESRLSLHLA